MIKVFIDTNVFLDVLLERQNFADSSEQVLKWCEQNMIAGFTSAISIANIFYIAGRQLSKTETRKLVKSLLTFVGITDTTKKDLVLAVDSNFADIEDAIQYYSALNIDAVNYIITRNKNDFRISAIPVLSPEEFISEFL